MVPCILELITLRRDMLHIWVNDLGFEYWVGITTLGSPNNHICPSMREGRKKGGRERLILWLDKYLSHCFLLKLKFATSRVTNLFSSHLVFLQISFKRPKTHKELLQTSVIAEKSGYLMFFGYDIYVDHIILSFILSCFVISFILLSVIYYVCLHFKADTFMNFYRISQPPRYWLWNFVKDKRYIS